MESSTVLVAVAGLILVALGMAIVFKARASKKQTKAQPNLAARFSGVRLDKPAQAQEPSLDEDPMSVLDHATANIDTTAAAQNHELLGKSESDLLAEAQEVLVANLLPNSGAFEGTELLKVLQSYELKFGEMNLFHAHDQEGTYLYSVMRYHNDGEQGGFDLQSLCDEQVDGLTFLVPLPHPKPAQAAEWMLTQSGGIARDLSANVYREDMQVLDSAGRNELTHRAAQYL